MRLKLFFALFAGLFTASLASAQDAPAVPVAPAAPVATDSDNLLMLDLSNGGRVSIQLRPDKAPASVDRIKTLARRGFYDGLKFHRVIDGFMAQGGDPKGDGTGGSDLPDLKAEFSDLPHVRGTVSMARAATPDSANSLFFIMLMPNLTLDRHYTIIGRVVDGMQYVDAIEKGEPPANPTLIVHASLAPGGPLPLAAPPPPVDEKAQAKAAKRAMKQAAEAKENDKSGQ